MKVTGVHAKLKLDTTFEVQEQGERWRTVDKMDEGTRQKDHRINKINLESQG
jgi:hypothetical protein